MEASNLEWRMYGLVPYNISPIQQGIQFGHAVQEYNNMIRHYSEDYDWTGTLEQDEPIADMIENFKFWADRDKTFIILNGGTTNNKQIEPGVHEWKGSLNNHLHSLFLNDVKVACFSEPDLGDQLTAVVFLVDERVWNKEKYPDRNLNPTPPGDGISFAAVYMEPETELAYEIRLGGKQNVWLREFLKQFRLA